MSRTVSGARFVLSGVVLAVAMACPDIAAAQNACSVLRQNIAVRDVMFDYYFWYEKLPSLNTASFNSPEEYLDALRYRPLDATFSYIASRQAIEAFFSSSEYIGLGVSLGLDGESLRILQVFPDSPAAEAGLSRGVRIWRVNGTSVADLTASGQLDAALGPSEVGYEVELETESAEGQRATLRVKKRPVTIPTVSATRVFDVDGRRVGYVLFNNFVEPSIEALDQAFETLRAGGVGELVLDLRYNGGGLVRVAQHLASLIGGVRTKGQVLAEAFHNDRHPDLNETIRFVEKRNALMLDRLFVIATRSTASASELIVNALRPFMPVYVIGGPTYGKPVGQYGFGFCEKILFPVSFQLRNARGEGDYFGGFMPECWAPDDADRPLGDVREGSLAEALTFVRTGSCSPQGLNATARRTVERPQRFTRSGFRELINAY